MTLHFTDLPDTGPVIEGAAPRYHHGHHPQCHQCPHVHRGRHGPHVHRFIIMVTFHPHPPYKSLSYSPHHHHQHDCFDPSSFPPGDILEANCTSPRSLPAASLKWCVYN